MEDPTNEDVTAESAESSAPALPPDDRIKCPSCGQMNRPAAEFCWNCAESMSGEAPMSAGARRLLLESDKSVPPSAAEGELDVSTELPFEVQTRRGFTPARIIGFLVFAAIAVFAGGKAIEAYREYVPAFTPSIGAFSLLEDSDSQQLQAAYLDKASAEAGQSDTRFYGDDLGATQLQLIWVKEPGSSPTTLLTQLPFGISESQVTPTTIGEETYYCTEILPQGVYSQEWIPSDSSGGVCAWTSGKYSWVLLSSAADVSTADLANVAVGALGVSAFILVGLWTVLAVATLFLAVRLVWASFFR